MLGADHPDVGQSISSLAGILTHQVRAQKPSEFDEARKLSIRWKYVGKLMVLYLSNIIVSPMLNVSWKLAFCGSQVNQTILLIVSGQHKYENAETLYREALAIGEKAYGHHHPEVATNLHNLAALLHSQVRPTYC